MGIAVTVLRALLEAIEAEEEETGEEADLEDLLEEITAASGGLIQVVEVEVDPLQAGYTTMGILTAACAVHEAHDEDEDCKPHHEALGVMINEVNDPITASMVISNLAILATSTLDSEDVQHMAQSLARAEAEQDDPQ
jgi:hypothetical protein